jgi:hypothetical protein
MNPFERILMEFSQFKRKIDLRFEKGESLFNTIEQWFSTGVPPLFRSTQLNFLEIFLFDIKSNVCILYKTTFNKNFPINGCFASF